MHINLKFTQWLSGLIDGDGCFLLSNKGYGSLEITVDIRDHGCLAIIKKFFGGSIKLRSGSNSIRYRLHDKTNLIYLLRTLSGHIRNSNRIIQYNKLCLHYGIKNIISYNELIYNNGWMAGFFDADGSVCINTSNYQLSINISQKTQELLIPLITLYNGKIYIDKASNTFKWYITEKEDIIYLLNNYFSKQYIYTKKRNRLFLIYKYYSIIDLKKQQNPFFDKIWNKFLEKWQKYEL